MAGILILCCIGFWICIVFWCAKQIGNSWVKMRSSKMQTLIIAMLLPFPVYDEIVGGVQFFNLCKQYDFIDVDKASAKGKFVYLLNQPDIWLDNVAIPIRLRTWKFVDVTSQQKVIEWHELYASPGIVIRKLQIPEAESPIIFKGACVPKGLGNQAQLLQNVGISQVQRSTIQTGEIK